jgi:VanZ family protein
MRAMRALGIALGWLIVATIIWLSVTPTPIDIGVKAGDKLGHLAAYGWVMFWFAQVYHRRASRLAYAAGFIAMGIALEFVQLGLGYRTFEVMDMVADAFGVIGGWALAILLDPMLRPR